MIETIVLCACTIVITTLITFFLFKQSNYRANRALRESTRVNLKMQKQLAQIVSTHNTLVTQLAAADQIISKVQQEIAHLKMNTKR